MLERWSLVNKPLAVGKSRSLVFSLVVGILIRLVGRWYFGGRSYLRRSFADLRGRWYISNSEIFLHESYESGAPTRSCRVLMSTITSETQNVWTTGTITASHLKDVAANQNYQRPAKSGRWYHRWLQARIGTATLELNVRISVWPSVITAGHFKSGRS